MDTELLVLTILKALVELAGMFLLGQGLLYLLAGRGRDQNLFYQLLRVITSPVVRFTRLVTPKIVVDRHVPIVAFILLLWLWVLLVYAKVELCSSGAVECLPLPERGAHAQPLVPVRAA